MSSTESPKSQAKPRTSRDALELAAFVAERVEIQNVFVSESHTVRSPDSQPSKENSYLRYGLSDVRIGRSDEAKLISLLPTFRLELISASDESATPDVQLTTTIALVYSISSFEGIEREHLEAFSLTNGIFNAWPYWREFVQNTTSRMGLDSVILPVYRVGEDPFHIQRTSPQQSGRLPGSSSADERLTETKE